MLYCCLLMMTKRASSLFLSLSLSVSSLAWADSSSAQDSDTQRKIDAQVAQRQMAARDAMIELQKARQLYSEGRYTDSEESYRKALSLLPDASATQKQRDFIKKSLADALVAKAMDYREVGRTEEAISFLEEAIELSPDDKRAAAELINTKDPIRHNPALTPQHVANVQEVNRLLTLAYAAYDLGKYDEAGRAFNAVLAIDSYNMAAARGLQAVNTRKSAYYRAAYDTARTELLTDVDETWDMREVDKISGLIPMGGPSIESQAVAPTISEDVIYIADALEKVMISRIVLEQASIDDFVEVLNGQLRSAHASGVTTKPINVIPNFGLESSAEFQQLEARRFNLDLTDVSMKAVLDTVSRQMGILYDVFPEGVELTYSGRDFGPIRQRKFTVPPSFFSADVEAVDDDFASEGSAKFKRVNPQEQLERLGVHFPEGASAHYSVSSRTLTVENTSYNLQQLDEVLVLPPSMQHQVMLNVYSMEVSQKDLEDLGFEWLINASVTDAVFAGGGVSVAGSGAPSDIEASGNMVTSGLRSGRQALTSSSIEDIITAGSASAFGALQQEKAPAVFGFRGVWSGADLTVLMRGLNQKKGVDKLYNPQIIFSPGDDRQVLVANVREFYVPMEYDPPALQENNSGNTDPYQDLLNQGLSPEEAQALLSGNGEDSEPSIPMVTPAHPSSFEFIGTTEDQFNGVGTTLAIHHVEVNNEGESLTVDLTAAINDFDGFVNWGVPIYSAVPLDDRIVDITLTENPILKPIFNSKFVNTSLDLAPGDVVVFAALHEAKIIKYEDKVPILGDIPLMGRLFRSEGTSRDKRVLLFFARIDLMDPTGVSVKTGERPSMSSR